MQLPEKKTQETQLVCPITELPLINYQSKVWTCLPIEFSEWPNVSKLLTGTVSPPWPGNALECFSLSWLSGWISGWRWDDTSPNFGYNTVAIWKEKILKIKHLQASCLVIWLNFLGRNEISDKLILFYLCKICDFVLTLMSMLVFEKPGV